MWRARARAGSAEEITPFLEALARTMTAQPYHRSGADLSPCGKYRYRLWRRWGHGYLCVWVMLNPSTADAETDDATIRRCVGFAKLWGYPGIEVVNLYPLRSRDPKAMLREPERWGPSTNTRAFQQLRSALRINKNAVCGWGAHAESNVATTFLSWAEKEIGWEKVTCLGVTKSGQPKHPVRLPYASVRVPVAIAQGRRELEVTP